MNVALLEKGSQTLTKNFPEQAKPPLYLLPSESWDTTSEHALAFSDAKFKMRVGIKRQGGELVLARVIGNLGQGHILYRPELEAEDGARFGSRQLFQVGSDELYHHPQMAIEGLDTHEFSGVPAALSARVGSVAWAATNRIPESQPVPDQDTLF